MALKTSGEKPAIEAPVMDTVILELAMYTHYTWGGVTYEKGTAYRFKRDDAMVLMSEQDHGRQIWRQWTPPKVKKPASMPIVESTEMQAVRQRVSPDDVRHGTNTGKRIDVGTDDEIADVLNRPDMDASGDVTV